jgi:hypothetical protein
MYSRAPEGFHDEPFEYVFSFEHDFGAPVASPSVADFADNPLELDPDADFYARGIAILIDQTPPARVGRVGRIDFNMRLRDTFGRPLDDGYIPMSAYAVAPIAAGPFAAPAGSPVGTPFFPELYCPASGTLQADFQAQLGASQFYSFHIYLQGVKRFKTTICE